MIMVGVMVIQLFFFLFVVFTCCLSLFILDDSLMQCFRYPGRVWRTCISGGFKSFIPSQNFVCAFVFTGLSADISFNSLAYQAYQL